MKAAGKKRCARWIGMAIVTGVVLWAIASIPPASNLQEVGRYTMVEEARAAEDKAQPIHATGGERATFAGGCFWCMEAFFEPLTGVLDAMSGYTGGSVPNPTYEEVSAGATEHFEAVLVRYDPTRISYRRLLEAYWKHIDPTDFGGQFYDRGSQYRTVIFYYDEEQKQLAEGSKQALEESGIFDKPIATMILPAGEFYPAEAYHQDYYRENPERFRVYVAASGKERFFEEAWRGQDDFRFFPEKPWMRFEKPSQEELSRVLTPLQYSVTQEKGTEPLFRNEYWDDHRPGIYVDVVSGEPLFSSQDKFDSGTGWPSFTRPLEPDNIVEQKDADLSIVRVEVRSRHADSHLGHVFHDGPSPAHLRYCINSAALRFVPAEDLEKEGYGEYLELFRE